jgi:CheY-like chemotaxis protein
VGRILVLGPEPEIRELVGRVAERLGHETITEESFEGVPIDAVVAEPEGARGLELATRLRAHAPDLPVICTSIAPPTPATRALEPRAHLIKPYTLRDLSQALSSALPPAA